MIPNSFSYLSYQDLRSLLKENKGNILLRLEVVYKNPETKRSLYSLAKLSKQLDDNYSRLAKEYYFFRLLKTKQINEILDYGNRLLEEKDDDTIHFIVYLIDSFGKRETLSENSYLYLMILYHTYAVDLDFAYEYQKGKYAEATYAYALYSKLYGKDFSKSYHLKDKEGVRSFISLKERETLSYIQKNVFTKEEDFISWNKHKGNYPTIRTLSKEERKEILNSLQEKECIDVKQGIIELLPGGFFLSACFDK